jgi:hypothetical protein
VIERSLDGVDLEELASRRVAYESRLMAVESDENVWALGTESEQQASRTLDEMHNKLALLGEDPAAEELRDKQRFLRGVLFWNLHRDYKARLWQAKRNLQVLERDFRAAQRSYHQVDQAREEWPEKFAALSHRIGDLAPRVTTLEASLGAALEQQSLYLKALARRELQAQRDRLSTYLVQARFALASVYDRSATLSSSSAPANRALIEALP